jgi:hypothetical protein
MVATTVETMATMSELRSARITSWFRNISPYQRVENPDHTPTRVFSLNENTTSTKIGK